MKKAVLFIIVLAFLLTVYYLISIQYSHTPHSLIWVHETYEVKDDISKNITANKLLIVSGSNSHFGISAEKISKELNISAINYGLHAGLKTYHFENAKKNLKSGDVVLIPLEYEFYWHENKQLFDQQPLYARYILTYDKNYYNQLSIFEKFNLNFVQLINLVSNIKSHYVIPKQTYLSKDINKYGDQIDYSNPKNMTAKGGLEIPKSYSPYDFDGPKDILNFKKWCNTNNITLIASFPSIIYNENYNDKEHTEFFSIIKKFYVDNNIQLLGEPSDFFYKASYFYDTQYHLNEEGKIIRTNKIIELIKKKMILPGKQNESGLPCPSDIYTPYGEIYYRENLTLRFSLSSLRNVTKLK